MSRARRKTTMPPRTTQCDSTAVNHQEINQAIP
jgi:hypothetical protein